MYRGQHFHCGSFFLASAFFAVSAVVLFSFQFFEHFSHLFERINLLVLLDLQQ